ncbi:MAG TPA: hypothetical protein VNO34_06210 [Actinomycetota bacterium]|nr:hypothetical protein [Actinomycetota bacterium]
MALWELELTFRDTAGHPQREHLGVYGSDRLAQAIAAALERARLLGGGVDVTRCGPRGRPRPLDPYLPRRELRFAEVAEGLRRSGWVRFFRGSDAQALSGLGGRCRCGGDLEYRALRSPTSEASLAFLVCERCDVVAFEQGVDASPVGEG